MVTSRCEYGLFYKEIDLFAMPAKSRFFGKEFEGLGLVYLEAGSFGLPILVGSSGGAFETIIPGKTGFIVGSRRDIYDGVKYFYDNPEEVESFGKRSRDFVISNFSWEKISFMKCLVGAEGNHSISSLSTIILHR